MEKTINKVELNGFIGINPEVKKLESGKSYTRFSLATSENYKDKSGEWVKNTTWHNVVLWNNKENAKAPELKKGSRVQIIGKLNNRKYTDKLGVVRYISEIVASKLEVVAAE
jgi:single-strand DNA-binding protein